MDRIYRYLYSRHRDRVLHLAEHPENPMVFFTISMGFGFLLAVILDNKIIGQLLVITSLTGMFLIIPIEVFILDTLLKKFKYYDKVIGKF